MFLHVKEIPTDKFLKISMDWKKLFNVQYILRKHTTNYLKYFIASTI